MSTRTGLWPSLKQGLDKSLRRSLWLPGWLRNTGNEQVIRPAVPRRAGTHLIKLVLAGWLGRNLHRIPKGVKLRFWAQIKSLLPEKTKHLNDPFDPLHSLLFLSQNDPFRLVHAFAAVHIWGRIGGGKTSGPGAAILKAYMRAKMGGLVLAAKPDEYELVKRYALETGRLSSLIRFAPDEKWRFNFLAYEQKRASRGAGLTANIVKLFTAVQESLDRGDDGGGKQERYWKNALNQLLCNAVDLCLLADADEKLSVSRLYDVITSAPVSPQQVDSEAWQESSLCYRLLEQALHNENLTERQKSDLKLTGKFWLTEFPGLPNDTRGSIVSTFTTVADGFLRGAIGELFSTGLNLVPEMTLDGYIVVVDLPLKLYGHVGLAAQILLKMMFQQC